MHTVPWSKNNDRWYQKDAGSRHAKRSIDPLGNFMGDHDEAAKRYRHQAEEFRAEAETMSDEGAREAYLRMAEAYERLAAVEETMAEKDAGE